MVSLRRCVSLPSCSEAGLLLGSQAAREPGGAGVDSSCTVLGSSSRGRLSTDDSPWRHGFQLILSEPREKLSTELPEAAVSFVHHVAGPGRAR